MNLSESIRINLLKESLKKDKKEIVISDATEIDKLLWELNICENDNFYIIFKESYLKELFFNKLPNNEYYIINANSSYNRFIQDVSPVLECKIKKIFNNINLCAEFNILNIINNTQSKIIIE